VKRWLKERLGEEWRWRVHGLSRLRWVTKYRLLRKEGVSVRRNLGYVLLDPEVGSFTFRVANVRDVLEAIAEVTGVGFSELEGFAREAESDPELGDRLARRLRWRFAVKHRPALGRRLGWYVLVRAVRPGLVCETGIYHGLGSLAILRALERNAAEGSPGELLSFDASAEAGSIVDRAHYPNWRTVVGMTSDTLEAAVMGRSVGVMIQDTAHTFENQSREFGVALRHADPRLVLVDEGGGESSALEELSRERGAAYRSVPLVAADHWHQPTPFAFALFVSTDGS
jgi:Methyltransferase domain